MHDDEDIEDLMDWAHSQGVIDSYMIWPDVLRRVEGGMTMIEAVESVKADIVAAIAAQSPDSAAAG